MIQLFARTVYNPQHRCDIWCNHHIRFLYQRRCTRVLKSFNSVKSASSFSILTRCLILCLSTSLHELGGRCPVEAAGRRKLGSHGGTRKQQRATVTRRRRREVSYSMIQALYSHWRELFAMANLLAIKYKSFGQVLYILTLATLKFGLVGLVRLH